MSFHPEFFFSNPDGVGSYYDVMRMIDNNQTDAVMSMAKSSKWVRNYALDILACRGEVGLARSLLEMGASKLEALRGASRGGHFEIIKLVDFRGIDQKSINKALCYASCTLSSEMVKLLLNKGANIHTDNEKPIRNAIRPRMKPGNFEVVKLLISRGADFKYGGVGLRLKTMLGVDKLPKSPKKVINMITVYEVCQE